jgi:hypothetical protein
MEFKVGDYVTYDNDLVLLKIISIDLSYADLLLLVYEDLEHKDYINKTYYLGMYGLRKVIFE